MRILVTGQTTLHKGRLEFGNIGNYYVADPFFKELRRIYPDDEICTTLQMSADFAEKYSLTILDMELYYSWDDDNYLMIAIAEYGIAEIYNKTGFCVSNTPYISEVQKSDIVIDLSGDIWGDNADLAGKNRFIVGLLKNRVAQLFAKKNYMLAGSPGPFEEHLQIMPFIHEVFKGFTKVTNRESISIDVLNQYSFDTSNTYSFACPSILFENEKDYPESCLNILNEIGLSNKAPIAGYTICGWNMEEGPYTKWPRKDEEYYGLAKSIEYIVNDLGIAVLLFSHSNGFVTEPSFKPIPGRDVPLLQQLYDIVLKRGKVDKSMIGFYKGVLSADKTRSLISGMDLLVSGRLHGAVAGLTQFIPTVMIDYGHEPKAHKIRGFAKEFETEQYIADPASENSIIQKIELAWNNRVEYKQHLADVLPKVKDKARKNFDILV